MIIGIWGSNGSVSGFHSSGNELGVEWDIGASSGAVSALFQGEVSVDYTDYLSAPGTTSLNLDFEGTGTGQLTSQLGAWADLTFLSIPIIDWDVSFDIEQVFTPQLGQEVPVDDSIKVADVGFDLLLVEFGASLTIEQENRFTATGIDGSLAYSLRGSGITEYITFDDLTDVSTSFDVSLSQSGVWDLWIEDMFLDNLFYTSFDAEIFAYEEHLSGVEWVKKCVGRSWYKSCWWVLGTTESGSEVTLAEIDLYDGAAFGLDFNTIPNTNSFSIYVDDPTSVPEPSSIAILGLGLAILVITRRKRSEA